MSRYGLSTRPLGRALARVGHPDLVAALAALQLLPENAEKSTRLKFAALAAISDAHETADRFASVGGSSLSDVVLGHKDLRTLAPCDDPLAGEFCSEVQFLGHGHLVLAGDTPGSLHLIRLLTRALFLHPHAERLPGIARARDIMRAGLTLSHEVCRRSGLRRNQPHEESATDPIFVPDESSWETLTKAVMFDDWRLKELGWLRGVTPAALAALTMDSDDAPRRVRIQEMPLDRRPLLRDGDTLVVVSPSSLCMACTTAAMAAIDEDGGGADLHKLLDDTSGLFIEESAKRLGLQRVAAMGGVSAGTHITLYSTDEGDDAVIVVYMADAPDDLKPVWNLDAQLERAGETLTKGLDQLTPAADIHGVALVVVAQETSRPGQLNSIDLEHPRIRVAQFFTAEEWGVFADTMQGDWGRAAYFLEDLADLRRRSRLLAWSILDPLDEWLKHRDSFYFGDDTPRENIALFLSVKGSGCVRRGVADATDRHTATGYSEDSLLEAERLYRGSGIPLYTPSIPEYPAIAVIDGDTDGVIWITAPDFTRALPVSVEPHFVEAIAYWMWRSKICWPELLTIELSLGRVATWEELVLGNTPECGADIANLNWAGQSRLAVELLPAVAGQMAERRDTERELVEMILRSIRERHPEPDSAIGDQAGVDSLLEASQSRMINIMADSSETDPRRLNRPIDVQPALVARILDALGTSIASTETGLPTARPHEIGNLLNVIVDKLFAELAQEVATFDSGLVAQLVRESEAQLRATRLAELNLAGRHACFSDVEDVISKAARESNGRSEAAIAVRFLVEYVAAMPTSGERRAVRSDLEHLVALASTLVGFAHESEMARVGLGPTSARILPSGRVGLSRQDHAFVAQQEYMHDVMLIQAEAEADAPGPKTPTQDELDAAMSAEFGMDLQTFFDAFAVLSDLASPMHAEVGISPLGELVSELATRISVDRQIAESLVNRLSLEAREVFEVPPPGHEPSDLWPWRFGRSYSYLARPLIRIVIGTEPESHVMWGYRHVSASARHLVMQMVTGRFRGRSREMQELRGRILHQHGEAFNDRVAEILMEIPQLSVWPRFDLPGRLGDVDVLVFEPLRNRLWVIECKDFQMTRVPAELRNDIEGLKKAQTRQAARVDWIRSNLDWVAAKTVTVLPNDVAVEPLIVMSALQLPVYLEEQRMPIVHIDGLREHIRCGQGSNDTLAGDEVAM
jgi:hypothetical protein